MLKHQLDLLNPSFEQRLKGSLLINNLICDMVDCSEFLVIESVMIRVIIQFTPYGKCE